MIKKITYIFIFICVSQQIYSMSRQYRGGEVYIKLLNNNPCFYIKNDSLIGDYDLHLYKLNQKEGLSRIGSALKISFKEHYPNKENCIPISRMKNEKLMLNQPYLIVLETDKFPFGSDFCVSEKNGIRNIQKFSDRCEDIKMSLWEKFLNFFSIN